MVKASFISHENVFTAKPNMAKSSDLKRKAEGSDDATWSGLGNVLLIIDAVLSPSPPFQDREWGGKFLLSRKNIPT